MISTLDCHIYALLTVKVAELVDLFRELEGVGEWLHLGLYLGVRLPRLMDIKSETQLTTKDRREQMLIERQKQLNPLTWSAVVKALVGIRREGLAAHLASKYGMFAVTVTYSIVVHMQYSKYNTLYSTTRIYRKYIFTFGVQPAGICLHRVIDISAQIMLFCRSPFSRHSGKCTFGNFGNSSYNTKRGKSNAYVTFTHLIAVYHYFPGCRNRVGY